ncbi:hypothetical protein OIU85_015664 [Salix viminalis]|uniref:DUF4220 domain-containing protein n=1 Tax=Salix viminalis TaxID=40686 RepID=A0A6N2JYX2_SALVM|nr:hypothetical protein OIU85_015664 [Salix viminalis]
MGLEIWPQGVEELWNEWQIRSLMLLSLLLQIILTILGEQRKYTVGIGDYLWLAYLSADSVAIFSLGVLARSAANSTNLNLIPVFWAPILLVHLGGPATITSYSMDQVDKLLINHLLQLVTRVGVVGYVLFRLRENAFVLVAIPIFISGLIKYGERIWVLKRSKASNNISVQPSAKLPCLTLEDMTFYGDSSAEASYLVANILFKTSKMLFQNLDLVDLDQRITYNLVSRMKAEEAFQLTEIELGLKYDRLYYKVATLTWPRIILRSVTFISSIFALVSFSAMIKSKSAYSKNDRIISYVLLSGVVCLESYSITRHLFSDWTMIFLSRWEQDFPILYRSLCLSLLLSFCRKRKRWPGLMGQHKLISALSKKPVNKLWKQYFPGNWNVHNRVGVEIDLKELIFQQVKEKRHRYHPGTNDFTFLSGLLEERGRNALETSLKNNGLQSKHRFDKVRWSLDDAEFSHSLLTWHIAIHICFLDDTRKNIGFASTYPNLRMSISLSNYMLYLLVQYPTMLAIELRGRRYNVTTIHLRRLLYGDSNISMDELDTLWFPEAQVREFFYELLRSPSTMLRKIADEDEGEMSALLDGCMLGLSLQSLETVNGRSDEKKWEMISKVWVEMLMYAATHCGWKEHTDALARGGELLTHVCLLMAHLGLCKQCPPEQNSQLEARFEGLVGILDDLV